MPKITSFLAYDDRAEEAVNFYIAIFENSKINKITRYGEGAPFPAGTAMVIEFELDGQQLMAMNGGPHFKLTDGFSLSVDCKDQQQVDDYNAKLLAGGGQQGPCGWLTDRFGLSWQVNPSILGEMLGDPDPEKAKRVMAAMLQMTKIDIEKLKRAYAGQD
jgi:predicted 3-demethylubiquinone-9 3-methyltransferase (glyoxalase superfamily)